MVRHKLVERGAFPLQTQRRGPVKRELRKNLHTAGSFLERRALGMSTYELRNHIPILLKLILVPVSPCRSSFVYPEVPPTQESQGSKSRK